MTTASMASSALPLPKGTFNSNTAGVPIIVVCTKADLIDDNSDMAGGAGGMGGMVKSKGGEWEERTDGVMQVLRTICLKCTLRDGFGFCILLIPFRWSGSILLDPSADNNTSRKTICPPLPLHPIPTSARNGKHRHSGTSSQSIQVHASSQCTR
jgi:hypothetical protein